MKGRKQISIIGGSVWGNRGAEAMLMTAVFQISQYDPTINFNVFSIYPEQDKNLVDDQRIEFLSGTPLAFGVIYFPLVFLYRIFRLLKMELPLPKSLQRLKASQCLIDIGGITFSDGRTLQLLYNVFSIWPAILLGVPVVKLSQAMGPFEKTLNRILAKKFLPKCEFVVARGEITRSHLETIGLSTQKYMQAADVAFLYEPDCSLSHENEEEVMHLIQKLESMKAEGTHLISLIPSSLVLKQSSTEEINFIEKLIAIIDKASRKHIHFIVLPNASRAGSDSLMNNDLLAIQAIRERITQNVSGEFPYCIDWVDYDINTRSIRKLVGLSDALITSRFHGMVAGLRQCVPTMVIGWSHKYQETLKDFGLEQFAIDYRADLPEILSLFDRFWSEREWIRDRLVGQISKVKASSHSQFKRLFDEEFKLTSTSSEKP